jgi:hypothetical protein
MKGDVEIGPAVDGYALRDAQKSSAFVNAESARNLSRCLERGGSLRPLVRQGQSEFEGRRESQHHVSYALAANVWLWWRTRVVEIPS